MEAHSGDIGATWRHGAYALLAVTLSYFEMIGKTLNPASRTKYTAAQDFDAGFVAVFPNVPPDLRSRFRDRARNGLYHLAYTKNGLWLHDDPGKPTVDEDGAGAASNVHVNPHRMTRELARVRRILAPGVSATARRSMRSPVSA